MSKIRIKGDTSGYVDLATSATGGKLGIGTDTPDYDLTVEGSSHPRIRINSTDNTASGLFMHVSNSGTQTGTATLRVDGSGNYSVYNGTSSSPLTMNIDGSGRMTRPNHPCFLANGNQGGWQTVTQGNTITVAFHQEQFDQGSVYNNSTMRFVAPIAGKYLLHFSSYVRLETNDDDTNHAYARIQKNGSNYAETFHIYGYANNGDADQMITITVIMDMAANDYAMCALSAASGSASHYQPGSQFMGYLIA